MSQLKTISSKEAARQILAIAAKLAPKECYDGALMAPAIETIGRFICGLRGLPPDEPYQRAVHARAKARGAIVFRGINWELFKDDAWRVLGVTWGKIAAV